MDISRARRASDILTDSCQTTSDILGNTSLFSKTLFRGNCILQMFQVFRHYMRRNPTKNLTVTETFTSISKFLLRENDVIPSNVIEIKLTSQNK